MRRNEHPASTHHPPVNGATRALRLAATRAILPLEEIVAGVGMKQASRTASGKSRVPVDRKKTVAQRISRHTLLQQLRSGLERHGYPRLQMLLLVTLTGGAGFLCSYLLLQSGVDELWLRYPSSVGVAYLVFLLLLWLWLRTSEDDYIDSVDSVDLTDFVPSGGSRVTGPDGWSGHGGRFGGSGASGHYDAVGVEDPDAGDSLSHGLDIVPDADELAIPLILLAIAVTLLLASVSIVYSAPALFAELLLDGVLAATLYRRLQRIETRHWLETAIRRTGVTFLVTAVVLAAAGWGVSIYAPEAKWLGEVIAQWRQ